MLTEARGPRWLLLEKLGEGPVQDTPSQAPRNCKLNIYRGFPFPACVGSQRLRDRRQNPGGGEGPKDKGQKSVERIPNSQNSLLPHLVPSATRVVPLPLQPAPGEEWNPKYVLASLKILGNKIMCFFLPVLISFFKKGSWKRGHN